MQNDIEKINKNRKNGKVVAGCILLIAGVVLLFQQIGGIFFPSWLFSWPMWLIAIGAYSGAKHNFRNPSSYLMIVIGIIFLLDKIFPGINFTHLFWPVIIISIGIMMILGKNHKWDAKRFKNGGRFNKSTRQTNYEGFEKQYDWDKKVNPDNPNEPAADYTNPGFKTDNPHHANEDYIDATSIFGSSNKTILSKNFKGGDIINIFGGAEIDFTQADFSGRVVIDVTQIFGGVKLLVPPHWHVSSDMVTLFAGFDDKRKHKIETSSDKVLIITGTSIFAGIEIRSY